MERKKYILILGFLIIGATVCAQKNADIYRAYVGGNMNHWKRIIDSMERIPQKSNAIRLELINYQYGYIGWCLGQKKKTVAEAYLATAEANLSVLEKQHYCMSDLSAYKAAFLGYKIGLAPYKAPILGAQSMEKAQTALKLDPNSALAYNQLAHIQFYMPVLFGGSKEKAIEYYWKGIKLMEKEADDQQNWNYLNMLVSLIKVYQKEEKYKDAIIVARKTLRSAPEFEWVKNKLLPELKKNKK